MYNNIDTVTAIVFV